MLDVTTWAERLDADPSIEVADQFLTALEDELTTIFFRLMRNGQIDGLTKESATEWLFSEYDVLDYVESINDDDDTYVVYAHIRNGQHDIMSMLDSEGLLLDTIDAIADKEVSIRVSSSDKDTAQCIVRGCGDEYVMLFSRGGAGFTYILHTFRGEIRYFKTLDTANKTAIKLGYKRVIVLNDME